MILIPLGQGLAVWLGSSFLCMAFGVIASWGFARDRGYRAATDEYEAHPAMVPVAQVDVVSLDDWQAAQRGPNPIPMWVLEAAVEVVKNELRAADGPLADLEITAAQAEGEIRRMGNRAERAAGMIP